MSKITRALLSVSDKTGIVEFAQALAAMHVEILSTGGTARLLAEKKIPVIEVADYTGFPEMLDGRVKTLHPKIHGGILGRRDLPSHVSMMAEHGIGNIDLVCVNLYPFEATIAKEDCSLEDAIENIDIGGPAMVRSAAKNHAHVAIVTDVTDYPNLISEMQANAGSLSLNTRRQLAKKAFSHTAAYDGAISNYLTALTDSGDKQAYPERLNMQFIKVQDMRYGENPHQSAAFYRDLAPAAGSLATYKQYQGKELSYNNIADTDAAWECLKEFEETTCVIVKHANPSGVGIAKDCPTAYRLAYATDSAAAYGGIIAFNRTVDLETAEQICQQFLEVLIAPGYTPEALERLQKRPNIRVLEVALERGHNHFEMKRVGGGILVQTPDIHRLKPEDMRVVTTVQPTEAQMRDMLFAWRVGKHVKSNALVFCKNGQTIGIGSGQVKRVDSGTIGVLKAKQAGLDIRGSAAASEAFLPFRDSVDVIAESGIAAIIQPGGSIRDEEVIAAANEHGIAMVFTGIRHFRH